MSARCLFLLLMLSLYAVSVPASARAEDEPETIATFSVAAYDPRTGEVGVAVQSRFFGVGTVVPWCRAGVGAVATQAFGQTTYGERGLELAATSHLSPRQILEQLLGPDDKREQRQVGMVTVLGGSYTGPEPKTRDFPAGTFSAESSMKTSISAKGLAATYTGGECLDWAGGKTGVTPEGIVYAVQGNILAGEAVVSAMAQAMDYPTRASALLSFDDAALATLGLSPVKARAMATDDLAGRMLGALLAGQQMGGDTRGMQSAALKVAQEGAGYGGYTDVKYDLRVDDAADPFEELARLLNLARPMALTNEGYNKLSAGDNEGSIAIFKDLVEIQPEEASHHYNLACALSRDGQLESAMQQLTLAIELDSKLQELARSDSDLNNLHGRADFVVLLDITAEDMAAADAAAETEGSEPAATPAAPQEEDAPPPGLESDSAADAASDSDAAHAAADSVNETVPPESWPERAPREAPVPSPPDPDETDQQPAEEPEPEDTVAAPFDEESVRGWAEEEPRDAAGDEPEPGDEQPDETEPDDDQQHETAGRSESSRLNP